MAIATCVTKISENISFFKVLYYIDYKKNFLRILDKR